MGGGDEVKRVIEVKII